MFLFYDIISIMHLKIALVFFGLTHKTNYYVYNFASKKNQFFFKLEIYFNILKFIDSQVIIAPDI